MSEPSPAELQRQHDSLVKEMRAGFASLEQRLLQVPTTELLTVHLGSWEKQLAAVAASQRSAEERHLRAMREHEERFTREMQEVKRDFELRDNAINVKVDSQAAEGRANRRWAIGSAIATAGVLMSFVGLLGRLGGLG